MGSDAGSDVTEPRPRWHLTCSCGWTRECVSQWAAESATKLHPRLEASLDHAVAIEAPPEQTGRQPELPLA